jgi:hypothetical protein
MTMNLTFDRRGNKEDNREGLHNRTRLPEDARNVIINKIIALQAAIAWDVPVHYEVFPGKER